MDGQPVWLASLSYRREDGRILAVPRWPAALRTEAMARLESLLTGAGDLQRQRLFRMNITLCLHRAATEAEVAATPHWFRTAPGFALAGGPVEVLWETVPGSASTRPCARPRKHILDRRDPLLWAPDDCGRCLSCRARARHQASGDSTEARDA